MKTLKIEVCNLALLIKHKLSREAHEQLRLSKIVIITLAILYFVSEMCTSFPEGNTPPPSLSVLPNAAMQCRGAQCADRLL